MRPFEYIKPTTVDEAASFLAQNADDALILGGGTAAVVLLHLGVVRPRYVVDLAGVDSLRQTTMNGALHLGALTSVRSLERDPAIAKDYDLLSEAASQVANIRVRNAATVGGAVAYGEPQTDTPVALTALDATIEIAGAGGTRQVAIADFYKGPYETALEQGELVVAVNVPKPAANSAGCHIKFTIGSPENKPVANASALITVDPSSGKISAARLVLGAVGATPVIAASAAGLIGETPNDDLFADIAAQAANETDPIEDLRGPVWYKRRIARVVVERALKCALLKTQE
jgi:aerobic carbon-monoxide dehydrogenase medium subunit